MCVYLVCACVCVFEGPILTGHCAECVSAVLYSPPLQFPYFTVQNVFVLYCTAHHCSSHISLYRMCFCCTVQPTTAVPIFHCTECVSAVLYSPPLQFPYFTVQNVFVLYCTAHHCSSHISLYRMCFCCTVQPTTAVPIFHCTECVSAVLYSPPLQFPYFTVQNVFLLYCTAHHCSSHISLYRMCFCCAVQPTTAVPIFHCTECVCAVLYSPPLQFPYFTVQNVFVLYCTAHHCSSHISLYRMCFCCAVQPTTAVPIFHCTECVSAVQPTTAVPIFHCTECVSAVLYSPPLQFPYFTVQNVFLLCYTAHHCSSHISLYRMCFCCAIQPTTAVPIFHCTECVSAVLYSPPLQFPYFTVQNVFLLCYTAHHCSSHISLYRMCFCCAVQPTTAVPIFHCTECVSAVLYSPPLQFPYFTVQNVFLLCCTAHHCSSHISLYRMCFCCAVQPTTAVPIFHCTECVSAVLYSPPLQFPYFTVQNVFLLYSPPLQFPYFTVQNVFLLCCTAHHCSSHISLYRMCFCCAVQPTTAVPIFHCTECVSAVLYSPPLQFPYFTVQNVFLLCCAVLYSPPLQFPYFTVQNVFLLCCTAHHCSSHISLYRMCLCCAVQPTTAVPIFHCTECVSAVLYSQPLQFPYFTVQNVFLLCCTAHHCSSHISLYRMCFCCAIQPTTAVPIFHCTECVSAVQPTTAVPIFHCTECVSAVLYSPPLQFPYFTVQNVFLLYSLPLQFPYFTVQNVFLLCCTAHHCSSHISLYRMCFCCAVQPTTAVPIFHCTECVSAVLYSPPLQFPYFTVQNVFLLCCTAHHCSSHISLYRMCFCCAVQPTTAVPIFHCTECVSAIQPTTAVPIFHCTECVSAVLYSQPLQFPYFTVQNVFLLYSQPLQFPYFTVQNVFLLCCTANHCSSPISLYRMCFCCAVQPTTAVPLFHCTECVSAVLYSQPLQFPYFTVQNVFLLCCTAHHCSSHISLYRMCFCCTTHHCSSHISLYRMCFCCAVQPTTAVPIFHCTECVSAVLYSPPLQFPYFTVQNVFLLYSPPLQFPYFTVQNVFLLCCTAHHCSSHISLYRMCFCCAVQPTTAVPIFHCTECVSAVLYSPPLQFPYFTVQNVFLLYSPPLQFPYFTVQNVFVLYCTAHHCSSHISLYRMCFCYTAHHCSSHISLYRMCFCCTVQPTTAVPIFHCTECVSAIQPTTAVPIFHCTECVSAIQPTTAVPIFHCTECVSAIQPTTAVPIFHCTECVSATQPTTAVPIFHCAECVSAVLYGAIQPTTAVPIFHCAECVSAVLCGAIQPTTAVSIFTGHYRVTIEDHIKSAKHPKWL